MDAADVAALGLGGVAAAAAIVSAQQAWRAGKAAQASAKEAVDAGHRAREPRVTVKTSGRMGDGFLPFTVEFDRDLDEVMMRLDQDTHTVGPGAFKWIGGQKGPVISSFRHGDALMVRQVHGGVPLSLHSPLQKEPVPETVRLNLRCECRVGEESWTVTGVAGPMPLLWG